MDSAQLCFLWPDQTPPFRSDDVCAKKVSPYKNRSQESSCQWTRYSSSERSNACEWDIHPNGLTQHQVLAHPSKRERPPAGAVNDREPQHACEAYEWRRVRRLCPAGRGAIPRNRASRTSFATLPRTSFLPAEKVRPEPLSLRHSGRWQISLHESSGAKTPSICGLTRAKLLTAETAAVPNFVSLCPIFSRAPDCAGKVRRWSVIGIGLFSWGLAAVLCILSLVRARPFLPNH